MAFALVMEIIGVGSMLGGIIGAGGDAQTSLQSLKDLTTSLQNETASWKTNYQKLVSDEIGVETELQDALNNSVENFGKLKTQIAASLIEYSEKMKQVQFWGILLVIFIFMLLLFKQFGLL